MLIYLKVSIRMYQPLPIVPTDNPTFPFDCVTEDALKNTLKYTDAANVTGINTMLAHAVHASTNKIFCTCSLCWYMLNPIQDGLFRGCSWMGDGGGGGLLGPAP